MMTNILVAYFSLTGHTQQVAEALAQQLHADLEPIADKAGRTFTPSHMAWFAMEALLGQAPEIHPVRHDPSEYDLVVLGTPVWAGHMATPVRTYVHRYAAQFKRLALFCTEGGHNGELALAQVAKAARAEPIAQLIVTEPELGTGAAAHKIEDFVKAIEAVPA